MNEREAIEFLKGKYPLGLCDEDEYKNAQTAIKALEKQIAKKPIFNTWSPVKCPTCGCDLNKSIGDGYYQRCIPMKFCECGQKLDWSEV